MAYDLESGHPSEIDHINGVLYPYCIHDRTKLMFESEVHHWLKQEPEK